jgi:hypothetical protein
VSGPPRPTPGPLRDKLADATGYPFPALVLRRVTPLRAINHDQHGQLQGPVTWPAHRSRPLTAR